MLSEKHPTGYNGKELVETMLAVFTLESICEGLEEVTQVFNLRPKKVKAEEQEYSRSS